MNDKNTTTDTAPSSTDGEGKLAAARNKLASLAEEAKSHDFKGDARKAAEGVKNLKDELGKHDFKAELREAFAEAKKNPKSIWTKPETPRSGKDLAVAGLAASVILLLVLFVTSGSFIGFVCLVLGLGALLLSALGLKTEGRKIAIGGSAAGLVAILCAFGQMFGSGGGSIDVEGEKAASIDEIFAMAENAKKNNSLNFYGFYTGMSMANAKLLREHYGLKEDDLWFGFNVENGEVFKIVLTPKAINAVMDVANNLETVELELQNYLGIVAWNNEKEIIEGEVDSIFQDESEKFWLGDSADVVRWYKTVDGVVVKLFPSQESWNAGKGVLSITDTKRAAAASKVNAVFYNNEKMRKERLALEKEGVETKILNLPNGWRYLLKKHGDVWVGVYEITKEQRRMIFGNDKSAPENFNALPQKEKGDLTFRLLFPEEVQLLPQSVSKTLREGFASGKISISTVLIAENPDAAKKHAGRLATPEAVELKSEINEKWERYSLAKAQRMARGEDVSGWMTEAEFKDSELLNHGLVLKDGNYYRGTAEEFAKAKEEAAKRAEERTAKAKAAKEARLAAEAAEEKAAREEEESKNARRAEDKYKFYWERVSIFEKEVWARDRLIANQRQRRWEDKANDAQKRADDAKAKIEEAKAHPEFGISVSIYETQIRAANEERDKALRMANGEKAERAKNLREESNEAKKNAELMETQAKNARAEESRLREAGLEKSVEAWGSIAASMEDAAKRYSEMSAKFAQKATELTGNQSK